MAAVGAATAAALLGPMIINYLAKNGGAPQKKKAKAVEAMIAKHIERGGAPAVKVASTSVVPRENLPASFAAPPRTSGYVIHKATADMSEETICDSPGPVQCPSNSFLGCLAFNGQNNPPLNPQGGVVLPSFQDRCVNWQQWRPVALRLHYTPTAGSNQTGSISMGYIDDPNAEISTMLTTQQTAMALGENQATGSANQPFSTKWISPPTWKKLPFLPLGATFAADDGLPPYPGYVFCYGLGSSATPGIRVTTGILSVELRLIFAEQRPVYNGVSLLHSVLSLSKKARTEEQKAHVRKLYIELVQKLRTDILEKLDAAKPALPGLSRTHALQALSTLEQP